MCAISEKSDVGRDSKGRFVKGNKGGPGNPFARLTAGFRKALLQNVSVEDLEAVARKLVVMARDGNLAAIKLLLAYVVGRPAEAVDPDQLDVEEWDLFMKQAKMEDGIGKVIESMEPETVLLMGREVGPLLRAGEKGEIGPFQDLDGNDVVTARAVAGGEPSVNGDVSGEGILGASAKPQAGEPSTNGGAAGKRSGRISLTTAELILRETREIEAAKKRRGTGARTVGIEGHEIGELHMENGKLTRRAAGLAAATNDAL